MIQQTPTGRFQYEREMSTSLVSVTPYGMYCYTVMGQGLAGGTHTYSRFWDWVFGAIAERLKDKGVSEKGPTTSTRKVLAGSPSLIGDRGKVAFHGMIDDSYGSAETFEDMFDFLHPQFFPRCAWGPMYLKGDKCHFFRSSLGFVGHEAGANGLRPSITKRDTILKWPTHTTFVEVKACFFLDPFSAQVYPLVGRIGLSYEVRVGVLREHSQKEIPRGGVYLDSGKACSLSGYQTSDSQQCNSSSGP